MNIKMDKNKEKQIPLSKYSSIRLVERMTMYDIKRKWSKEKYIGLNLLISG
jgi:hypothetical protein